MIKLEKVSKHYGDKLGISDVSFNVEKNEIVGLLGANGAGKTTIMNIITGYISYDAGTVDVVGYNVFKEPQKAKRKIGYLPEKPPLYMDMTVQEYLHFCAELKGIDKALIIKHINEISTLTGIENVLGRLCNNLSKGYMQRVGLAQALIGNPEILILDEPTIGLDPHQIIQIRNLIKKLGQNHTIIISSHVLSEIAQICSRVIILKDGEIAAANTLDELKEAVNKENCIDVRFKNADQDFLNKLEGVKAIKSVEPIGEKEKHSFDFRIYYTKESKAREAIFNLAVENKKEILMMREKENSLEELFLKITNSDREGVK